MSGGPFNNSAIASGLSPISATYPAGKVVTDISQDGTDPDPVGPNQVVPDHDPTKHNDPTPLSFGAHLFDPPFGVKLLDTFGFPIFHWTLVWINDTNIVDILASSSDPIPEGTKFVDNGIDNGFPLPPGSQPAGTVTTGVACTNALKITTTTYCYFEGPTPANPRGRIVWQGVMGPDLAVTDPELAKNAIHIDFSVSVDVGAVKVKNSATINADLDGNGTIDPNGEQVVALAEKTWVKAGKLPETGFGPGVVTILPPQPRELVYDSSQDLVLEIPSLNLKTNIVGVPSSTNGWDITWLGNSAGYLVGTAYPTLNGNSVITGHVYDSNGLPGPFVNIGKLKWGDKINIYAFGQKYVYQVRAVNEVQPDDKSVLAHKDASWITLLTCKDYNKDTHAYALRIAVQAELLSVGK